MLRYARPKLNLNINKKYNNIANKARKALQHKVGGLIHDCLIPLKNIPPWPLSDILFILQALSPRPLLPVSPFLHPLITRPLLSRCQVGLSTEARSRHPATVYFADTTWQTWGGGVLTKLYTGREHNIAHTRQLILETLESSARSVTEPGLGLQAKQARAELWAGNTEHNTAEGESGQGGARYTALRRHERRKLCQSARDGQRDIMSRYVTG